MALSMDEERILAEIEQHLARTEPVLATRLASFGRSGPVSALRSPRARVLASCVVLAVVAVVSLIVYALTPLRAMPDRIGSGRATSAPRHPTLASPYESRLRSQAASQGPSRPSSQATPSR